MVAGHVYSDSTWLSASARGVDDLALLYQALTVIRKIGTAARAASAKKSALLDVRSSAPVTKAAEANGAETPSRSRAEMDALAAVPGVRTERLPRGKLSVHEEFPDEVAFLLRASFVGIGVMPR